MEVLCIKRGGFDYVAMKETGPYLTVGDTYNVVFQQMEKDGLYYALEGFPDDIGFSARLFATFSDIDERSFERNYQKETV